MNIKSLNVLAAVAVVAMIAGTAAGETIEREISAASGEVLEINLETGGSIEIVGWGRNAVVVEAEISGRDASQVTFDVQETARGVRIESNSSRQRNVHSNVDVKINVPQIFDIEIESKGGGIRIENVDGRISGRTMGGELDLSDLRGELELKTMGGGITLRNSEVDGEVKTMGGQVLLEDVTGDIRGKSMGGNVIQRNVTRGDGSGTGEKVLISTMGGEIKVDSAPAGAELDTMGGNIEVTSASEVVTAKTMGGDINLASVDGSVKATTMGGDVEVTIVDEGFSGSRDVEIVSMSGEIHLTVPADLGMEIDIELDYTKNSRRRFEIHSDFPLSTSETPDWSYSRGSARKTISGVATVAGGGNKIIIRTVNGDVFLKRGN